MLEIEFRENKTKIKCLKILNNEILWTDLIKGQILLIDHNDFFICYYSNNLSLHINYCDSGRRAEMQLIIDNLCYMKLNKNNEILLIKQNGELLVYDIKNKKQKVLYNLFIKKDYLFFFFFNNQLFK